MTAPAPPPGTPDVLLVLAKSPVAGQAKTRLCPPATPREAAAIAAASLLDTLEHAARAAEALGARVLVAWTGTLALAERADELARALAATEVFEQVAGDLGCRIAAAHQEVARRAPGSAVLQIGMDTPQQDATALVAALATLHGDGSDGSDGSDGAPGGGAGPGGAADAPDAVLGLALDGGWWALGLRDPRRAAVLAGVEMSRADTGMRTRAALVGAGLTVTALPEARDVDTAADAHAVAALAPGGRFAAEVRARLRPPAGDCATW